MDSRRPTFLPRRLFASVAAKIASSYALVGLLMLVLAAAGHADWGTTSLVLLTGVALAALAAIAAVTIHQVLRPTRELTQALERLAAGDLTVHLGSRSADEFGAMARAFDAATTKTAGIVVAIGRQGSRLAEASTTLTSVSNQMSATAAGTGEQANSVAAATQQISASVSSVAAATEQMSVAARQIAENTAGATQTADAAVSEARSTATLVTQLSDASARISQVITVITTIADQTKLLALNATIEAARAGEAGRGFAVVAGEVKELAASTQQATGQIEQIVSTIGEQTSRAVAAITSIGTVIDEVKAAELMIASAIEEQQATTAEISHSVHEAADGVATITANVDQVAAASAETGREAATVHGAAQGVQRMATDLDLLVGRFRLTDRDATGPVGMAVRDAAAGHVALRLRLIADVEAGRTDEDPAVVGADNRCALAGLIAGLPGSQQTQLQREGLLTAHTAFHRCAGSVAAALRSGDAEAARAAVAAGQDFDIQCGNVLELLRVWRDRETRLVGAARS